MLAGKSFSQVHFMKIDSVAFISDSVEAINGKHELTIRTDDSIRLLNNTVVKGSLKSTTFYGDGSHLTGISGTGGDMQKSIYDVNANNEVDTAEYSKTLQGHSTTYFEPALPSNILANQYLTGGRVWATLNKATIGIDTTNYLLKANNLSDLTNIVNAKTTLSLQNVDNTSDVNKPVSTAQNTADLLRVLKAGDTMTGDLLFHPVADVNIGTDNAFALSFKTNNTSRFKILSTGEINSLSNSIKFKSSSNAEFGNQDNYALILKTNDAERMRIDSLGKITITNTLNKLTFTTPSTGATLTLADNSSLVTNGAFSATLYTTGTTTDTLPTSGTLVTTVGTQTLTNKSIAASQLTGSIADARLSANVPLLNASNTFTGTTQTAVVVNAQNYQVNGQSLFEPESVLLFTRMTTITPARAIIVDSLIKKLKADTCWTTYDAVYVLAAEDSNQAKIEWTMQKTAYKITTVNSPTFTVNKGYASNGTSSFLKTGFVPSTATHSSLNDIQTSIYCQTNVLESKFDFGCKTTAWLGLDLRDGGSCYIMTNDANFVSVANSTSIGYWQANRVSSSHAILYKNGVSFSDKTSDNSNTTPNVEAYISSVNGDGNFSTKQYSIVTFGSSMSAYRTSRSNLDWEWFMDRLGTGVEP